MSIRNKILSLASLLIVSIACFSMLNKDKVVNQNEFVSAIKFMDQQTYPSSITEKMFWENGDKEFARMNLSIGENVNSLKNSVLELKKVDSGLTGDFDFAFLIKKKTSIDTIYASLQRNLWTIKEKGEFQFYLDSNEELKEILQGRSAFFSDCW